MFVNNDSKKDEISLWKIFCDGDDDAYDFFYRAYVDSLFILGNQYTPNKALIEDAIHDLFVYIYENRGKLKHVVTPKTFLLVSFRNRLYNALKSTNKELLVNQHSQNLETDIFVRENESGLEILISKEKVESQQKKINSTLEKLTLRQREVIHYRYYEGLTISQISDLMSMNYQSVSNLLHRAINKIKENFANK